MIQVFEETELERFILFLNSPYFHEVKPAQEIIILMQHIKSCFPDFKDERLSKTKTYAVLYPGQDFIPGKLDRVMSNLLKIIKEFVIYEFSDLKEDQVKRNLVMARFYRQRRLEKHFERTVKSLREIQQQEKKKKDFYLKQFLIEQEVMDFESLYNQRKTDYNVAATLESLDVLYLVHRLEFTCWLLAQNKYNALLGMENNMEVYDRILTSFKEEAHFEDIPLLKVYEHGIRLLRSGDSNDEAYRELTRLLAQYVSEIPVERLKELQALCRNYCTQEYNKGRTSFLEEIFTLYRDHLKQGYLLYEGGLLQSTFRNIVLSGLRAKEYEWVNRFLEQYKDRIVGTNQPEEIYLFNLAIYYFAIKEYSKALDCLADRYEDAYYLIAAKRMELKIYYEMDFEIIESKINAFKVYIYRISQKILPQIPRDGNNNFIDILKQIRSSKTLYNAARIEKLINKVQTRKSIAEKEWLLQKLAVLKENVN